MVDITNESSNGSQNRLFVAVDKYNMISEYNQKNEEINSNLNKKYNKIESEIQKNYTENNFNLKNDDLNNKMDQIEVNSVKNINKKDNS